jgi:hypothetical protein
VDGTGNSYTVFNVFLEIFCDATLAWKENLHILFVSAKVLFDTLKLIHQGAAMSYLVLGDLLESF